MLPLRVPPLFGLRVAAPLAAASGLAGAYAFPRVGIWPLAVLSVAGLSCAVDGRRVRTGAWLGMVYGLFFFIPLLHWTGIYVGAVPWLLLAVAEAVFCAGLGAALSLVQRLPAAPGWIGAAWVLEEALRDRVPFGGFPWGRLAFSQADSPLRWLVALGGAPLLSFGVALAGGAIAVAVRHVRPLRLRPLCGALTTLVLLVALAAALAWPLGPRPDRDGPTSTVALVQGNVPGRGLAMETRARQVLDNHVRQTMHLAAQIKAGKVPQPDLVVWPENASDVDPFRDPTAYAEIQRTVRAVGAPVLVGAILQGPGPDHRRNAGILWSPTSGPGAQYIKRHPVPFAEYIPMRSIAEWVSSAAKLVKRDMVAGHGNGLLTGGPYPIGDVICFEVAYDGLVRSSVEAGAQLLVVQTNNATFGHTSETYQQLAMSRLRALEHDRTVLQVSTTGATAVIGPDGTVRQQSAALFEPAVLSASVPLHTDTTPATWLGAVPEYVLAALALLGVVGAIALHPPRAQRPAQAATSHPELVAS